MLVSTLWVYEINRDVNLRKGPDNQKRIIRTVPKGETIQLLEKTNEWWWQVEYKGKKGYIASNFISRSYPKTTWLLIQGYPYESLLVLILFIITLIVAFKKKP